MSTTTNKAKRARRSAGGMRASGGVTGNTVTDLQNPALWLSELSFGRKTASGERVSPEAALSLSTYWACLNNGSQDVAKLPLQLRRRRESRGSDEAVGHPVWMLTRRRFNPVMGPMQFRMTMQHRLMAWGNAYAEIVRDGAGRAVELWPIHPVRIKPVLENDGRTLRYEYRPDGKTLVVDDLAPRDILHLRGMGSGIEGLSVLQFASEVLGLGLAAQRFAGAFYGEGMAKRMVAVSKENLGPKGREALRQRIFQDKEGNPVGSRRLPFLEGDITLQDVGIPPEQAQFLESRTFSVPDIARWFRMSLAKLQHTERAQGWSTLESLNRDYATDALQPWTAIWEEECWLKLLNEAEHAQDKLYFKHRFQAMLQADLPARYSAYVQGVTNGWLSPNDVRELEDMNPIVDPAADEYRQQAQMRDLGGGGAASADPAPAPTDHEMEPDDVEALRPVFMDAASRMAKIEANEAARLAQRHAKDAAAHATEAAAWNLKHARTVADAFGPLLHSTCLLVGHAPLTANDACDAYSALGLIDPKATVEARAVAIADAMMGLVR